MINKLSLAIFLAIIFLTGCAVKNDDDNLPKENPNSEIIESAEKNNISDFENVSIGEFYEGLAVFKVIDDKKIKYGVVDINNNIVVKPDYDQIYNFENGYACMMKDGRSGIVNSLGEVVIQPKYQNYISFSEGFAFVFVGEKSNDPNGYCCFINTQGEEVIKIEGMSGVNMSTVPPSSRFENGTATVKINDQIYIINTKGEIISE